MIVYNFINLLTFSKKTGTASTTIADDLGKASIM